MKGFCKTYDSNCPAIAAAAVSAISLMLCSLLSPGLAAAATGLPNSAPADWITLNAHNVFSLRVPPRTSFRWEQGIDSFASTIVGPDFEIVFDYGMYSPGLEREEHNPRYTVSSVLIDGRPSQIVAGPNLGQWGCKRRFMVGLYVPNVTSGRARWYALDPHHWLTLLLVNGPELTTKLAMSACIGSQEQIPVMKQIFRSIRFDN